MTLILAPTLLSILRKSRFLSRPHNLKLSNDANVWTLTVFPRIYIPSDFTEETCSIATLSIRSSSVSDRVLNLCLEPINVNSVFVALKVSLLDRSHLLSFSKSWDVMSVSSAYILGMLNWRQLDKSLIQIRNNRGPRIIPCGTPHSRDSGEVRETTVNWAPLSAIRPIRFRQ